MPTFAGAALPPPKAWEELEDICRDSFGERWSNPNLTRHGRQGQAQQGVDIYGNDEKGRFVGIQCKNTFSTIRTSLIDKEVKNAENFTPAIHKLYIATSSNTDASIQSYARTISDQRVQQGMFGVQVIFWPEIQQDLCRNTGLVLKHYPQLNSFSSSSIMTPRDKDVQNLKRILEVIDFDYLLEHLSSGAKYIHFSVEECLDRVLGVRRSPIFSLNDQQAIVRVDGLVMEWLELRNKMSFGPYELNHNNVLVFRMIGDAIQDPEELQAFNSIDRQLGVLSVSLQELAQFTASSYPEIDLLATSQKARSVISF